MKYPKYLPILLPLYATLACVGCVPEVRTASTLIRGSEVIYGKKAAYQFMGIPFAKPPVGDLRFKKTVPLENWSGEFDATKAPPACSQYYPVNYDLVDNMPGRSEDCLYLNIWVPSDASPLRPKAVMIWLYAVGFATGSNRLYYYNASALAAEGGVIVVVPNYRVSIFGFLSTDSEDAPGNMGLYDVLEALKWVRSNIKYFGGDVDRITMSGNTAGSLISGLFTISPLTKNMFHRVIMESGADLTVRGNIKQYNLQIGQQVATIVGCASESRTLQNNTNEVIECLKSKTADELVTATNYTMKTSTVLFLPIYGDEFLPETPSTAYRNGNAHNVNVLIGNVRDEGTFTLATDYADIFGFYGSKDPVINKTLATAIIEDALRKDGINSNGDIPNYYLSNVSNSDNYKIRDQTAKAISDFNILCNDYYFALDFLKRVDVYFYYFIHRTPFTEFAYWTGVTIFSEVPYVFGIPIYDSRFTKKEARLSKKMVRLWSNFVKYGDPSDWQKFDGTASHVKILKVKGDEDKNSTIRERFNNCKYLRRYILNYGTN